ncbi:hypothetical protein CI109_104257 [Kwoniella shandongensis]|uniref:Aminoglycoside phosphotransferase domain-containing protein n=1 Tax=Kwoniella shandongensis TaxID=1734106 RepID=A0A5M6C673_9TREE|nr:uncharacterized protein CI109_002837 [Kwoniella shandongensis]KAA5528679.1 hypothetical protein CI109_002837 [Kwoniella shandongensis]
MYTQDPDYASYPDITRRADKEQLEQLTTLLKSADLSAQANSLRPGHTSNILIPTDTRDYLKGGMNVILPLTFDDGVKWVARVRQKRFDEPPVEKRKILVASEVESLRVMKEAGLQVPAVYFSSDQAPDLNYYFLDFVGGTPAAAPLTEHDNPSQIPTIIRSFAQFQIALSELTFPFIGSLHPSPSGGGERIVGPLCDRYIKQGRLFQHKPVLSYLAHLEIKEMVVNFDGWGEEDVFYLKHADDKGDHLMIDPKGNITNVIDWEWAYITSKAEAFAAPCAFSSVVEYCDQGRATLCDLEHLLMKDYQDLGRPDLADCVKEGKKYQFLNDLVGEEPQMVLMDGLRETFSKERKKFAMEQEWEEWAKKVFSEDQGLKDLLKKA